MDLYFETQTMFLNDSIILQSGINPIEPATFCEAMYGETSLSLVSAA